MLIPNSVQFAFRQKRERIDWKKIASVDIDRVARDVDFQTLQDNASNVTFCDIQAEVDPSAIDLNFMKLFRLAQLIIEYLMYSQDCLSTALSSLEQQVSETTKEINDLKEKLLKEKSKNKKLNGRPPFLLVDNGSQSKCQYCPKMFFNDTYLRLHHERRHPSLPLDLTSNEPAANVVSNLEMEKELAAIKERLKTTEDFLREEKSTLEKSSVNEQNRTLQKEIEMRQEMENWKKDQIQSHKKELESMKDIFLKEMDILNQKYLLSERQLQELHQKTAIAEPKLDTSILMSKEKEMAELGNKHQQEIMEMKALLREQVIKVEKNVQQQLKDQDSSWKYKLRQLEKEHSEEINKLNDALHSKQQNESQQYVDLPDMESSLNRQIKELEKLNIRQTESIKRQERRSRRKRDISPVIHHSTPNQSETKIHDLSSTRETDDDLPLDNNHYDLAEHSVNKVDASIKHNPIIIQGMRDEISNLLDEKLARIGISKDAGGVKESALQSKLANQRDERRGLTKKYKSLLSIREQLQQQVEQIAQRKMRETKTAPSTPTKARKSIQKLFNSVKEKVKAVRTRSSSSSPAPPPRRVSLSPAKRVIESTPISTNVSHETGYEYDDDEEEDEDDDELTDDSESSSNEEVDPKFGSTGSVTGVSALAKSLEKQLENRKKKPAGGIDVFVVDKNRLKESSSSKETETTSKVNPNYNGISSSLEDIFNATSKNKPPLGSKGETENSSNTAATSAWGSSASKQTELMKRHDLPSRPASSLVSVSSWDSEDEVSELS